MKALAAVLMLLAAPVRAAEPRVVGLRDAIDAAVGSRLDAVSAGERSAQARARARQASASLLPQVTASLSESRTFKENLAAQGLNFPGFPSLLGPFNTFDARARLSQKVFDWGARGRMRSGDAAARQASAEEEAAREQVAAAAALSYLEALRAQRAVLAARADKDVAASLLALAQDRKEHGAATGVDVVRAQARDADADAALLRAQVGEREAQLLLKRVAGWPFDTELKLGDDFTPVSSSVPALGSVLPDALAHRAELAAAEERARAEEFGASAVFGDRLPSLTVGGDYGLSGTQPSDSKKVGAIGASLSLPVYGGGLLAARQRESRSRHREAVAALADMRSQVELDVRSALERLAESAEEEKAAELSLKLGERELAMAQDRYAAGVGASVDLVEAQAELARTRSAQISALARYHSARVNLAAAVGRAAEFSL